MGSSNSIVFELEWYHRLFFRILFPHFCRTFGNKYIDNKDVLLSLMAWYWLSKKLKFKRTELDSSEKGNPILWCYYKKHGIEQGTNMFTKYHFCERQPYLMWEDPRTRAVYKYIGKGIITKVR